MEKKIAECIKVLINLGNYQNIEIAKYAEQNISYSDEKEMKQKEDQLTIDLVDNIIRNMRQIPEKLGKKTNAIHEVENRLEKSIPEWLTTAPIPNLANSTKNILIDTKNREKEKSEEKNKEVEKDKKDDTDFSIDDNEELFK